MALSTNTSEQKNCGQSDMFPFEEFTKSFHLIQSFTSSFSVTKFMEMNLCSMYYSELQATLLRFVPVFFETDFTTS